MTDKSSDKPIEIPSNSILTKYIAELQSDVTLNEYNLREKALLASSMWAKWLGYLQVEKSNLDRIQKAKLMKKNMIASTVKTGDSVLRMKSEDKMAENDETLQKLNAANKITQDNIDFIERALNILSNFSYQLRNVTEVIKLNLTH